MNRISNMNDRSIWKPKINLSLLLLLMHQLNETEEIYFPFDLIAYFLLKHSFLLINILPENNLLKITQFLIPQENREMGARYLDSKYSRWISVDPALGEYVPQAPVNDEAKKQNQNLPGMGGVFNSVNLNLFHYGGNNPVKYSDPDGRIIQVEGDDKQIYI